MSSLAGESPLFVEDRGLFIPSGATRGGWSDEAQHGSPPAGLLARAIERVPTATAMQVVRFTIDLFRPVPLTPLRVETSVRRDGQRIQVVEARLLAGDVEVGMATGLKIRVSEVGIAERDEQGWVQPPPPEEAERLDPSGVFGHHDDLERFHTHAIEIRTFDNSFVEPGPGLSWFRLLRPLVEGEEPSRFVRLAIVADMSNGNSSALDPKQWLYVNPDITLYSHRLAEGDWIGMRSEAHQHRTGIGLADTRVFDVRGPLGRINQAQLLEPR